VQKFKVSSQSVLKTSGNKRTDGGDCITSLGNAVGKDVIEPKLGPRWHGAHTSVMLSDGDVSSPFWIALLHQHFCSHRSPA